MSTEVGNSRIATRRYDAKSSSPKQKRRRRLLVASIWTGALLVLLLAAAAWLTFRATTIKSELQSATALLPTLKTHLATNEAVDAGEAVKQIVEHTGAAREAASDPLWTVVSALPWIGPNFEAVSEVATSADDVARLGAVPLVHAFQSLDWSSLTPTPDGISLEPLRTAAPQVQAAAHAVRESANRLANIDDTELVPQVATPLIAARGELADLNDSLDIASDAANLAPQMLGADAPRRYLLLMQNNAESRATGGIPGALAVLSLEKGHLHLESQTSAGALGTFTPPFATDTEQQAIYSARMGKFMQDVNLTPDFGTTAKTASAMWEKRTGEHLDGVVSLDPVALSFMLEATGPVKISDPTVQNIGNNLPTELTSKNVVQTLLSDVYAKIADPKVQDAYFAGAAKEIFSALSSGKTDPKKLLNAVSTGVEERRILLWSDVDKEQQILAKYSLAGLVSGSAVTPAQFGVYFNDGTGAKMDFWVKRQVQIVKDCTRDGFREVVIRVTSTNTAPADAASSLPSYVTGVGTYGVPPGSVQTNVVAYGPVQSNIDTVVKDGKKVAFAAQRHGQRSVGTSTIRLAPGESTALEFSFGHIIQHAEPELVVTPTTQPVKDVIQPASVASCEK
ncbi:DUF4012 domain-containing protein [Paenarthrobacter nicotinovorans]|uniref:DUF4012 domain-containing protein n=1 Tax=Paenarthrobacter nicotinovorans TaxID=29320 RepID=UPI003D678C77